MGFFYAPRLAKPPKEHAVSDMSLRVCMVCYGVVHVWLVCIVRVSEQAYTFKPGTCQKGPQFRKGPRLQNVYKTDGSCCQKIAYINERGTKEVPQLQA